MPAWRRTDITRLDVPGLMPGPRSRSVQAGELVGVDRGEWTLAGEHADNLVRREIAEGMDRFFGVVGSVWRHNNVGQGEQGIVRFPVALFCRFFFDVVQAG